ncbi:endopeptidase La [Acetivibrio ethanolgignens]|uniref:Lon protease n=1 Tax=Acetivibrio ethanolgignens TaxID=290052 RepID=A0A0V8QED0_9FIRM|nr:endopeptidase La [Acetivibrio ethanolgignens]KSV58916.1 peptidase [Acetivibrio ethanolgignens]
MNKETFSIPVIALRGMNVLPGMMLHFDIKREKTVAAIEEAILKDQKVFIVAQKDARLEEPERDDLYDVGTISVVKQLVRLPDNLLRVMTAGIERGTLGELTQLEPFLLGEVSKEEDTSLDSLTDIEKEAMLRELKELMKLYAALMGNSLNNVMQKITDVKNLSRLVEEIINNIPVTMEEKQAVLEELTVVGQFNALAVLIANEIQILRIRSEFQGRVKEQVDKNQKEYLLREQMKVIQEELGENVSNDAEGYKKAVEELEASSEVKEKIRKEIKRFKSVGSSSSESAVIRGYIEALLALPWDKKSVDNPDIKNAMKVLNRDHYGLKKVKDRVLEFLAVRALTEKGDSPIICLVGPPGTGKTSIARSVAEALGKKYVRIGLGGVRDEAEIRGHRRTYVGAMPGRLAAGLKSAGVKNPLILLDEIDKTSSDYKGDTASALLEVLDAEQNSHFVDHYVEIPLDLSEVLFIATANSAQDIPRPLLDRMELIEVSSYTENEKLHIAKEHLLEKAKKKNGLSKGQLTVSVKALEQIISGYTKEAGVRNLERRLGEICRKAARELLESDKKQIKVTDKNLEKYLGKPKYAVNEANKEDEVGIVRGLAWTSVGGETLEIEVNVMPGKGEFELTGQLGDVMKESAVAGISYIRSVSSQWKIRKDFFEKHDIHVHIPEGAVPKDGPSAGITMATAMLSAITGKKVRADIAMTGEITLRGRVLPIGGLKEKLLAAKMAKLKMALIPKENERDLEEIEPEILEGLKIYPVETMEQVISYAFAENKAVK